jgi:hypothetical protein
MLKSPLPIITQRICFSSSSCQPAIITHRIAFAHAGLDAFGNNASHAVSADIDSDDESVMHLDPDEERLLNDNEKVPKPPGEPGRPRSGGYNVKNELHGWDSDSDL